MISTVKGGLAVTNDPEIAKKLEASHLQLAFDDPDRVKSSVMRWRRRTLETHPRAGALFSAIMRRLELVPMVGSVLKRAETFDQTEYAAALNGIVRSPTRLSAEQAAIALIQLPRIEDDVKVRNRIARELFEKAGWLGWRVPTVDWTNTRPSLVRFPAIVEDRNYWLAALRGKGIEAGACGWIIPCTLQVVISERVAMNWECVQTPKTSLHEL